MPPKKKGFIKALDIPVIALAVLLTIFIAVRVSLKDGSSSRVIIRGPQKTWIFPLDAGELVTVSGLIGETKVMIHRGSAAIVSSPCSGQTCVAAGELNKNGQWAACLPNAVILLVEGAKGENAIDAVSW